MELTIMSFVFGIGLLIRIIILKVCYMKHTAICLDSYTGRYFVAHTTYEFELPNNSGEMITYQSRGTTIGYPRKGKRYKVMIRKDDYNKIVGYAEYIQNICLCAFFLLGCFMELIL